MYLYNKIIDDELSVRKAEQLADRFKQREKSFKTRAAGKAREVYRHDSFGAKFLKLAKLKFN